VHPEQPSGTTGTSKLLGAGGRAILAYGDIYWRPAGSCITGNHREICPYVTVRVELRQDGAQTDPAPALSSAASMQSPRKQPDFGWDLGHGGQTADASTALEAKIASNAAQHDIVQIESSTACERSVCRYGQCGVSEVHNMNQHPEPQVLRLRLAEKLAKRRSG
jgi:hypothetical protein